MNQINFINKITCVNEILLNENINENYNSINNINQVFDKLINQNNHQNIIDELENNISFETPSNEICMITPQQHELVREIKRQNKLINEQINNQKQILMMDMQDNNIKQFNSLRKQFNQVVKQNIEWW